MDMTECSWCSQEIEDGGIPYKGMIFCSEECRAEWKEDNLTADDIDFTNLDDETLIEGRIVEEDLELDDDIPTYEDNF